LSHNTNFNLHQSFPLLTPNSAPKYL